MTARLARLARLAALAFIGALILASAPRAARAQDASAADEAAAREHYERGRAAYDEQRFDDAIKELKQAYMVSRKPAILFNIGQTYDQLKNTDLALHFFQKFLAESDPEDTNRPRAQAAVDALQARAAAAEGGKNEGGKNEGEQTEGERPDKPTGPDFRHVPVGEAPPRKPVDVKIRVADDAKSYPSFLYYRAPGEETFTKVPMTPIEEGSTDLSARIPKSVMNRGKSIQYYVETRTSDGSVYGTSGTAANPNVIVVDPKAKPKMIAELDEESDADKMALPPAWTKVYRPLKYVGAAATLVALGVTAGLGAYGARLSTDIESRSRNSSVQNDNGTWSSPSQAYDLETENLDQKGRRVNVLTVGFAVTTGVLAIATGAFFLLDYRRGQAERAAADGDVALGPIIAPGMAGVGGAFRF